MIPFPSATGISGSGYKIKVAVFFRIIQNDFFVG